MNESVRAEISKLNASVYRLGVERERLVEAVWSVYKNHNCGDEYIGWDELVNTGRYFLLCYGGRRVY